MIAFHFRHALIAWLLIAAWPDAAAAQDREIDGQLVAMRALDARVAAIGHRLAVGALDLCTDRQWLPGFAVHDLSQYRGAWREAAIRSLGLGDSGPAVLAVVAGGPADRVGLRNDDVLLGLDGVPPAPGPRPAGAGTFDVMAQVLDGLEAAFADGSARLDIERNGRRLGLTVAAEQGCATRFQLIPSARLNALADGRYVQVTTAIGNYVADDEELAAILAHELAHNALRHRARLDAAGVDRGLLGHFGRSARLVRATEIEADRLSVYLLDRAGYDPEAAVRFWQRFGGGVLGLFNGTHHPSARRRIQSFREEIARIRQARAAGAVPMPAFLARSSSR